MNGEVRHRTPDDTLGASFGFTDVFREIVVGFSKFFSPGAGEVPSTDIFEVMGPPPGFSGQGSPFAPANLPVAIPTAVEAEVGSNEDFGQLFEGGDAVSNGNGQVAQFVPQNLPSVALQGVSSIGGFGPAQRRMFPQDSEVIKQFPVLSSSLAHAMIKAAGAGAIVNDGRRKWLLNPQAQIVGRVRKRRRLNPLNFRAAKRSARRLEALDREVSRFMRVKKRVVSKIRKKRKKR